MTTVILFDCFGVLVQSSLEKFYDVYFKDDEEKRQRADRFDQATSRGTISYQEYVAELSLLADISARDVSKVLDNTPVNTSLLAFIRDNLAPQYRIGMLSNAADNWLDELFDADDRALFEHTVLSYQVGFAKPDPRIYRLAAERFSVEPEQCLFVDDIARYCDAAHDVGMQALQYRNFSQFQQDILAILGAR